MKNDSLLGKMLHEQSCIPVKPDFLEIQTIHSIVEVSRADSTDPAEWDADSRLFGVVSRNPDIAGPLGHDGGGTILIFDFPEAVEVVAQSFKLPEKTLHPRPHLVPAIVLGVVLIVENDIFGIEPQARSVVEAIGINRINVFFKELLSRSLWTGRIPGRSRNTAY